MAATATGSYQLAMSGTLTSTMDDGTAAVAQIGHEVKGSLTSGTGANAYNRGWKKHSWALTDAATVNIDLFDLGTLNLGAGAGEDLLGLTQANTELVGIIVASASTSVGSVMIGGEGSAAAWQSMFHVSGTLSDTAGLKLLPGASFMVIAPLASAYAIADSSNHLLKLAAAGGAVTFNVDLFLRGAA